MNPIKRSALVLSFIVSLIVYSPTRAEEQSSVEKILAGRNQVIVEKPIDARARTIQGWQNVNLQNVVLEYGDSKLYLVELNNPCPILDSATTGITMGHLGKTVHKGDSITIWGEGGPNIKGGKRIGNCQIEAIYRLESTDKKMGSKS